MLATAMAMRNLGPGFSAAPATTVPGLSHGTTIIHGPVADQAALHGLLQNVRDVGLPLIPVTHIEPGHPRPPAAGAR
jgi:hypothetical protein